MKILALGAGGFIGTHLTERLLAEGHEVIAVDLYHDKLTEVLEHPRLRFIKQDIREIDWNLDFLVAESDVAIDLIAYANPGLYVKMPLEVFRLNFTENLKIAEACLRQRKRLIQFSTCEVYGRTAATLPGIADPEDPRHAIFNEDISEFILGPVEKHRWIYACAKQLLERVIHAYGLEYGFNWTVIRPFNFIGAKIDYLLNETDGIPRVFSFFMEGLISGTTMKLVDGGKNRRCYTYIEDAVECIYRIILNEDGVCDREIFNIGTPDNEVSIRELAESMRQIYVEKFWDGQSPLAEIVEVTAEEFYGRGYEDSDRRIPDITKARVLLGWEPRWNMRAMLETTMRYYITEYLEHYRRADAPAYLHDILRKARELQPRL